jgi:hypothetical protein
MRFMKGGPSHRTGNKIMTKSGTLDNPRDFFEEITRPSYVDFFGAPSSFRTTFSLAMSLFNLHEWVFEFNKADVETEFGKTFAKPGDLWQEVERQVPEAKFIRDLSNASKHVKLTIRPSTSMTHIANTEIQVTSYGAGGYGQGRYSAPSVVFHDSGNVIYLDECARKLFAFWEILIDKFYPPVSINVLLGSGSPPSANS